MAYRRGDRVQVRKRLLDDMPHTLATYGIDANSVLVIDQIRHKNKKNPFAYRVRSSDGASINLFFRPWEIRREVQRR